MDVKAVLMSTQPKWCELIDIGKKTNEIRKTRPKLDVPFKVYIYCTKKKKRNILHTYINSVRGREKFGVIGHWRSGKDVVDVDPHLPAYRYNSFLAEGKVIGEFVCHDITKILNHGSRFVGEGKTDGETNTIADGSCLMFDDMKKYLGTRDGYAWHISDLVIYDKPKSLSEFHAPCDSKCDGMCYEGAGCCRVITRPPQSWCYVEELK